MNATKFQTEALAWLAAAVVILPFATGFVIKILGAIGQVKAAVNDLRSRQDAQSKHLVSQQQQITTIALHTQPSPLTLVAPQPPLAESNPGSAQP